MKSIQAEYDNDSDKIIIKKGAQEEDWPTVCKKFNDDVSRIRDVSNQEEYTGLYQCLNDNNELFYYLVQEDKELYRAKHRHFLDNIGL